MGELPVDPTELHTIYQELADTILAYEDALQIDLPIETTAGVSGHLTEIVDQWQNARKSLRTTATVNVYARELPESLDQDLLRVLVGVDAEVNVLDDIIDTKDLPTEQRVALTANAAFASLLIAEHAPPADRDTVATILREYFTALFQIPLVESRLFEQMRNAETQTARREASREIYAYRARDIDAFARIPALVCGLDEETEQRLLEDLRAYRARRLLFKDIADVSRDLADDDMTPILSLLTAHDSIETIRTEVEQIYASFEYTPTGKARYGDILNELEGTPDPLAALLREQQQLVRSFAN